MFKRATCFTGFLMDKRLSHEFMISGYHIVIDSGNFERDWLTTTGRFSC